MRSTSAGRSARAILAVLAPALPALAQDAPGTFPATLAGHAMLPAMTLAAPPADAPRDLWISGKFTGKGRNEQPMSVPSDVGAAYGGHGTGISLPFIGQPVLGMSGLAMNRAGDGSWYVLTDNGFGSKINSPDAMLFFHRMKPDFDAGTVTREETVFLRDPDRKVPFRIANEGTDARLRRPGLREAPGLGMSGSSTSAAGGASAASCDAASGSAASAGSASDVPKSPGSSSAVSSSSAAGAAAGSSGWSDCSACSRSSSISSNAVAVRPSSVPGREGRRRRPRSPCAIERATVWP